MNHPLLGPYNFHTIMQVPAACKVCGCSSVVTLQYKYNATIPMHCTVKQICNMQEGETTLSTQMAHEHIQLQLLQCSKCADRSLNLDGIQLVQRMHARQRRQISILSILMHRLHPYCRTNIHFRQCQSEPAVDMRTTEVPGVISKWRYIRVQGEPDWWLAITQSTIHDSKWLVQTPSWVAGYLQFIRPRKVHDEINSLCSLS